MIDAHSRFQICHFLDILHGQEHFLDFIDLIPHTAPGRDTRVLCWLLQCTGTQAESFLKNSFCFSDNISFRFSPCTFGQRLIFSWFHDGNCIFFPTWSFPANRTALSVLLWPVLAWCDQPRGCQHLAKRGDVLVALVLFASWHSPCSGPEGNEDTLSGLTCAGHRGKGRKGSIQA